MEKSDHSAILQTDYRSARPTLSVVIPVYNSEATLSKLIETLGAALNKLSDIYEVILVNDGSIDGSWNEIRRRSLEHPWIRGIDLMRNYGQHNALLCGIRAARNDVIIIMDDDLQHPPSELSKLLSKLLEGYDVVYGVPQEDQQSIMRNLAARVTKMALKSALGAQTAGEVSPYKVFRAKLRDAFAGYQSSFVSLDVLLTWGASRFGSVPVRYERRSVGKSQYSFQKLVTHALNMMTGFSIIPLQVATLVGFSMTAFGILVLGFVLARYLLHGVTVPGFTFLASIIVIFSGAQLFALGIFGEYLARIHFRMMERPPYVVSCITPEKNREQKPV
jgi:undecaprenyl-phosphate 4-deoxy-4-formamido-L-arabinose transferase